MAAMLDQLARPAIQPLRRRRLPTVLADLVASYVLDPNQRAIDLLSGMLRDNPRKVSWRELSYNTAIAQIAHSNTLYRCQLLTQLL
jgi:hypothetical protein